MNEWVKSINEWIKGSVIFLPGVGDQALCLRSKGDQKIFSN